MFESIEVSQENMITNLQAELVPLTLGAERGQVHRGFQEAYLALRPHLLKKPLVGYFVGAGRNMNEQVSFGVFSSKKKKSWSKSSSFSFLGSFGPHHMGDVCPARPRTSSDCVEGRELPTHTHVR